LWVPFAALATKGRLARFRPTKSGDKVALELTAACGHRQIGLVGLVFLTAMKWKLASGRAEPPSGKRSLLRRAEEGFTLIEVLGVVGLALLLSGCATHRGAISKSSGDSGFAEPQVSRFGTVVVAEEAGPASFSFQKAKGKLGTVKEAILDSAELGLSGPGAGLIVTGCVLSEGMRSADSEYAVAFYAAAAGVAGGVTGIGAALAGPVVGAEGLIRSLKRVGPAELAEREAALTDALSQMAEQEPFRGALLQSGAQRIRGGFISSDPKNPSEKTSTGAPDAMLEARVDDLRLERAGSDEGSYFLRIKTHARLVRVADGATCFEQRAEYRSGTALFLDWTLQGAIQGVAETGYQALARYYIDQLLIGSSDHANTSSVSNKL
jgi:hypothetical protein